MAGEAGSSRVPISLSVNHVGVTVGSVPVALEFWERFLDVAPLWRRRLNGAYLSEITGFRGLVVDAAMIELSAGLRLELLDYEVDGKVPNDMSTANPGNVHLCFEVEDIERVWQRAIDCGAEPVSANLVEVSTGPNQGAVAAYLRVHDGVTIELVKVRS